jgi:hypothetical protein
MSMDNQYVTSDLYLTAYLKIKGFNFKVEQKKSKSEFVFESSPELLSNVDEYLSEMGNCKPLVYTNAIKNLKNYIYNKK